LYGQEAVGSATVCALNPAFDRSVRPFVEKSGLLPNPLFGHPASWKEVVASMPKAKDVAQRSNWSTITTARGRDAIEDAAKELWPPRAKTDMAIRRTRFNDWYSFLRSADQEALAYVQTLIKDGFDYIFVVNIMMFISVYGIQWMQRIAATGAFDYDVEHYTKCTKKLNDIVKTRGLDDPNWSYYAECSVMAGYRNPPFPGFDPVVETKSLAEGGVEHNYFGHSWTSLVREAIHMNPVTTVCPTFEDFVLSAAWLTAGSSSVGKLEIELPDGKVLKVKSRKNTVPDVVDLPELLEVAKTWHKQVNYSIVKSELGKIRMAVACDMYMYLQMSWINVLLNGAYNQWEGSTTDEDFISQTKRMWNMICLAGKKLGLPFDYAAFDHQPTTEELTGIISYILEVARHNCPVTNVSTYDKISVNILSSFYESTLQWRNSEEKPTFKVTGGLMSGLRFTSLVGNAWNSIMTKLALKLSEALGISTDQVDRYIRGDDSAIFVPNWGTAACIKACYDVVGVKAGEGKFSLQEHGMEFLRVWYAERCYGYPSRAAPGLTQRKPWSSAPWSPDYVIKAIYETVRILRRRLEDSSRIDKIWKFLSNNWCRDHSLPRQSLQIPTYLGGFGIEPFDGCGRLVPPVLTVEKPAAAQIRVLNQTNWRADKMAAYYKERYQVDIDTTELARTALVNVLSADDIPEISRVLRKDWLYKVRRTRFRVVPIDTTSLEELLPTVLNAFTPSQPAILIETLEARAPAFGSHPELATATTDYHTLRPKESLREWLKSHYPRAANSLRQFHRSWYIGESIDYLTGKLPVQPSRIHPSLVKVWFLMIAGSCPPSKRLNRLGLFSKARKFEIEVWNSSLSKTLYRW
jgi:hypothetical protein